MIADLVIANLLRIAREDLDGASVLLPRGNRNAAYLCEQAAEKIIRGPHLRGSPRRDQASARRDGQRHPRR